MWTKCVWVCVCVLMDKVCVDKVYVDKVCVDKECVDKECVDKECVDKECVDKERGREEAEEHGIQNQKQEPHTKLWGTMEWFGSV